MGMVQLLDQKHCCSSKRSTMLFEQENVWGCRLLGEVIHDLGIDLFELIDRLLGRA